MEILISLSVITGGLVILFVYLVTKETNKSFDKINELDEISKRIINGLESNDEKYLTLKKIYAREEKLKEKRRVIEEEKVEELKKIGLINRASF
ncbi:MAG: hypothetical protein ACRBFS_07920 [Aureispira sp.]